MNRLNKSLALPAAAFALAVSFAAPAAAGKSQDIVVTSHAAMQEWQQETTRDLNHALTRAPVARTVRPNDAVVQITFTLGEDGKAENLEVLDGKGNWAARKAAIYAVKRLDGLGDVPVYNPESAQFLANIIFASNREIHDQLAAKATSEMRERYAQAESERYILLGG
ncbi:hypothetical protein [Erythrobacter sp. JK5]|uniref:hypothetical protein n=1 Tax=Erythrobacter sp. JK5 TaxID=2829500 RepID=UPI001BA53E2F|nr:hypothetical protein [Erythrobacter sp. JK5]QUL37033.1 hypothetical protein KDC96_11590 [Erythrobacter sp. JK5]